MKLRKKALKTVIATIIPWRVPGIMYEGSWIEALGVGFGSRISGDCLEGV